jgi:two-component system cell cycle response regulator
MSARILVVDDIESNRRLLEARLTAEYFEVDQAASGQECLDAVRRNPPDLILLDIMMPGLDGFETCRRLKADVTSRHIPVIMVTALDQREDRIKGLEAGADDFLTKPVDEVALFARVRSLLRLKVVMDELRLRDLDQAAMLDKGEGDVSSEGRIVIAAGDMAAAEHIASKLPDKYAVEPYGDPREALEQARRRCDLLLIDLTTPKFDGLRLCARLRSDAGTRHLPIVAVVAPEETDLMVRALDLGVNDVVFRPVDGGELAARVATQVRRKHYTERLRGRLEESLEMAVTDPLTGLHNRRYVASRLEHAVEAFAMSGELVSVILFDIDHFKRVNDTFGHQAGDDVLRGFSERLSQELRALDLAGRFGGEEFLVLAMGAQAHEAMEAAERVRAAMARSPFVVRETGQAVSVTISAGVAEAEPGDTAETLLRRADRALYEAKASGRNQVVVGRKKAA